MRVSHRLVKRAAAYAITIHKTIIIKMRKLKVVKPKAKIIIKKHIAKLQKKAKRVQKRIVKIKATAKKHLKHIVKKHALKKKVKALKKQIKKAAPAAKKHL